MNKTLLILILSSSILFSQNKELIKETFYSQSINNIDKIASKNGFDFKQNIYINASFKCNNEGEIFDIKTDTKSNIFEKEIKKFIAKIPKLNPQEYLHKGDTMKYGIKMNIKLPSKKEHQKIISNKDELKINYSWLFVKEYYPVKIIEITERDKDIEIDSEEFPVTENCKDIIDVNEKKNCVAREISMHVNKKFDSGLAANLPGKRFKVDVSFYVSKNGEIVNITAEGPTDELIEEGIRAINTFPDFYSGGKINGNPVDVKFTFPIVFQIN